MAYTDRELALKMAQELVGQGLILESHFYSACQNPGAPGDFVTGAPLHMSARFPSYWSAVSGWLAAQGAHVASMNAQSQPGRRGGYLGFQAALYSECFGDIAIRGGGNSDAPSAVRNHLRFIKQFM